MEVGGKVFVLGVFVFFGLSEFGDCVALLIEEWWEIPLGNGATQGGIGSMLW